MKQSQILKSYLDRADDATQDGLDDEQEALVKGEIKHYEAIARY